MQSKICYESLEQLKSALFSALSRNLPQFFLQGLQEEFVRELSEKLTLDIQEQQCRAEGTKLLKTIKTEITEEEFQRELAKGGYKPKYPLDVKNPVYEHTNGSKLKVNMWAIEGYPGCSPDIHVEYYLEKQA